MLNFGGVSNHRSGKNCFPAKVPLRASFSASKRDHLRRLGVSHRLMFGAPWFPVSKKEIRSQEGNLSRTYGFFQPKRFGVWCFGSCFLFFLFQLMVNWWFGLVVWDSRGTQKSLFKRGSQESKPPTLAESCGNLRKNMLRKLMAGYPKWPFASF